jgi:hypothetical protein
MLTPIDKKLLEEVAGLHEIRRALTISVKTVRASRRIRRPTSISSQKKTGRAST